LSRNIAGRTGTTKSDDVVDHRIVNDNVTYFVNVLLGVRFYDEKAAEKRRQ
jgi:hypothetical protein